MVKVLLICGVSGSGKSYVENMLKNRDIHLEPQILFNKLTQVTTRKPRNQEEIDNKVYRFVDKDKYDKMKNNLIARTEINGNYYGTINTILECDFYTVINTIIVNRQGWEDVYEELNDMYGNEIDICTLRINCDIDNLEKREDRDIEYLKSENKKLLHISDISLDNNIDKRLTTNDIIKALQDFKLI